MKIATSAVIERPVADVWRWYAVEHVRNHPRWDPDMELEQISEGPIGLGTRIRRRNRHFGEPIEGEMEIVEWEPAHLMGVRIHDANADTTGRVMFESLGPSTTLLTIEADLPSLDASTVERLRPLIERTASNIRRLVESDADGTGMGNFSRPSTLTLGVDLRRPSPASDHRDPRRVGHPGGRPMPQPPRRSSRSARQPRGRKASATADEHVHEPDAKLRSFTYRGKTVDVHAGEHGCCVVIDGERVDYSVEPDGIYSHEMAYQKFGSPEELAEEVIRQWGQAKVERTPVPHDHDHDHDHPH